MTDLLTAALQAAGRGWPVFVLGRSKRPVANCEPCRQAAETGSDHDPASCGHLTCHGFYAATTDPDRVAAIVAAVPRGQLAVRSGAVSGLVVVDVDPAHGGDSSLSDLMTARLVPRTLHVHTGSGGLHLYYRHPGQHLPSRPMPHRAGIDIKADGGYVVLPPSIHHRTHRPYQWGTTARDLVEMPPLSSPRASPLRPSAARSPACRPSGKAGASPTPPSCWPPTSTPYAAPPKAAAATPSTAPPGASRDSSRPGRSTTPTPSPP